MKKIPAIFLTCVLAFLPTLVIGQVGVVIEGTVTDNVGNPLPGANIFIQGTTYGAAAGGRKGAYEFTLPAELALGQEVDLHAQFIGFRSKTVKITLNPGTITQNFELEVDVLELESIVVTGLGETLIKEKLGVSIAIVKPKVVRRSGESNVVQALAGKAAGVVVRETSGDPGTNSFIRIRGGASIDQNTQPLFVVDGVPINNQTLQTNLDSRGNGGTESTNRAADLNTEDIESIEILKGPAASAIYGSRASNGVVLITTKSGKPGRTKISYKLNVGSTTRSSGYPLQQWFGQGTKGAFRKNYSRSWGRPLNVPGAPHYDASQPEDVIYDHLDEISTSGWSNENNITLSGGQQNTSFFISFGRIYEQGYWKADRDVINSYVSRGDIAENFFGLLSDKSEPASYERYTARIKASQVISQKIKLTANLAYANTEGRYLQRGDNAIGMMLGTLRTPPEFNNWPYIDANTGFHRSYRFNEADELRKSRRFDNPFFIMYEHENPRDVGRLYGYLRAEYDMLDWMQFKYTLGSDYSSDDATALNPPSGSREDGVGRIRRVNFTTHEIDANLLAIIKGEKFLSKFENIDATFLLGHNINRREFKRLQTQGVDFGVPGFNQLDNTVSTNLSSNEFESLIHTESCFG
ncbi:MAG: TonB-dependent receptor plug domain-containing protein, partial [Candidatus Poribacteria bacterium]